MKARRHIERGVAMLPWQVSQLLSDLPWDTKLLLTSAAAACLAASIIWATLLCRRLPVFLLDYSCHLPDPDRRVTGEVCEYVGLRSRRYSQQSADFMRAIYRRSGVGDETYGPASIFDRNGLGSRLTFAAAEADEGMFAAAASLLRKTGVPTNRISALVVVCSMFSPAPSLSSRLVNRFGLRPDVKSYNLSGMGCSAGALGMDLACMLLRRVRGYALLVVTEAIGLNWYFGNDRQMLVTNCIFRAGTAAALLTSDDSCRGAANYELLRTLRTHHGHVDASYSAAMQSDDGHGNIGVALTKDLVRVAGASLRTHITTLAPRVLPVSELLRYAFHVVRSGGASAHVPDFTTAFEHMCIHSGGKAVVDAVGRIMRFDERLIEPARMCLHRFGNTSSSLVFYELGYFEAKGRVRRGDRVWILAFGTGFKACSVVCRALRDAPVAPDNPWNNCIHRYPVKFPL